MKAKLVQIGNSKGLRIPKAVIEQVGLQEDVELEVQGNAIVVKSAQKARNDWSASFQQMAKAGDDQLLDTIADHQFDDGEWEW